MANRLRATALALGLLGLSVGTASAAPVLRVQVDQKGDFVLLGNTLGYDCAAGTPLPLTGTLGACGNNTADSAPDIFWRADSPAAGQAQANNGITLANARSTSVLTLPAGATVTHAFLYWGATAATPVADTTITLDRPGGGGFTQNITAIQSYLSGNNSYQSVADVTALVQANGAGAYRVSGVDAVDWIGVDSNNHFAGWWMAVFYQLASDPPRNLALFEGLDAVSNGQPQNVTIAGFVVPNAGFSGKLGVVTFEGDNTITGDQLFFNGGAALTNAQNPADNFFNGTRTLLGNVVNTAGDLPRLTGGPQSMSGIDLDVVDISAKLSAGQMSAPISATSTGDVYYLAGFITSISTFKPDFSTSVKTAIDVNGGALVAGDTIQYTIVVTNTGNDTSINTVLTDALPAGVTYKPGTLQITAGPNNGAKSDSVGNDQGEFTAGNKTVTFRLGAGANGTMGGTLASGATTTVAFQVTVDAGASGTISNQAVVNAGGQLGAPPTDTPTDGNGGGPGNPPTDIQVDQCVTDAQCAAPTPFCKVAANPNICVQCLLDTQCPGNLPTCSAASNTCVCVPSGAEVCDAKDNDCNGQIDEGFNLGAACTVGVGECTNTGVNVCNAGGIAVCSVSPGASSPEICDGKDNDCDGVNDDGNPGSGVACASGLPGVCGPGTTTCTAGAIACVALIQPGQQAETCNGVDEDCDGTADNGFNVGGLCTSGIGACLTMGVLACNPMGGAQCTALAGEPSPEVCGDQIDNDCNGAVDNGCTDTDGDGLFDDEETQLGTDPNDADSDDDGVPDGQEPSPGVDSDGDGLINALDPDSDDDGLFDGTEMGLGCNGPDTDATKGTCIPDGDLGATKTDPLDADTDDGGVSDGSEDSNLNGVVDQGETDPTVGNGADDGQNIDTDGDGLTDKVEITLGTDPNDADSDDDGVPDGQEPNPGVDSDGDGLINALDPDSDNDGLFDGTELGLDCSNVGTDLTKDQCVPDGDLGATVTSPIDPDTDDGGINDGSEDTNLNGVIDPGETDPTLGHGADDSQNVDTDGDGLTDNVEITLGTNPNDADSDDDGLVDGLEPNPGVDTDGDGLINALDPDSDGDGLFDGTELGKGCDDTGTDTSKNTCIPDGDMGATTTSPLDPDTDDGGVKDGDEDVNHNGVVDPGEKDPNNIIDDPAECVADSNCGPTDGGMVCDDTMNCVPGCRGTDGNGCPSNQTCTSKTNAIGTCVDGSGGAGGGGGKPEGVIVEGNGIFCAARAGSTSDADPTWLVAGAFCAVAALRRRRR